MENLFTYNNTESNLMCKANGNDILGVGLDDVNKLKSIVNPTMFWLEEGDQAIPDDVMQLQLRLRGPKNKCFLQGGITFNPISAQHWLKLNYFDIKQAEVFTHHSTYKDNIFLSDEVKHRMEVITDPYYKRVYVDGDWGIFTNGVFTNFVIEDFDYTENDLESVFQGMDFGFEHAQAIERAGFKDGELYCFDELHEKHRTNTQFMGDAKEYFGDRLRGFFMPADSANPDKIKEWQDNGYRVEAAKKGPGSLRYGIEYLTGLKIHIHKSKCKNLAKEIQLYKRREDRDGNPTEDFVEMNDDGIAALRYGSEFIWANRNSVWIEPEYSLDDLGL
jgi:phage terminase large subunit